jgi:hypothetical protein
VVWGWLQGFILEPKWPLRRASKRVYFIFLQRGGGGIAQLVERLVRNEKAWGSNPHTSTIPLGFMYLTHCMNPRKSDFVYGFAER